MTYFSLTCTSLEMRCPVHRFAPAAFVQAELGVDQVALVLEQPLDAVVRATALFVGRERDDDVAIGLEAFALVANQVGDPDRRLRFVVADAAAVEVAVFFGETNGSMLQSSRLASTTSVCASSRIGLARPVPW